MRGALAAAAVTAAFAVSASGPGAARGKALPGDSDDLRSLVLHVRELALKAK